MGEKDENRQKERGKSMYFSLLYLWLAFSVFLINTDKGVRERKS